jgi:hypothetical protein
MTHVFCNASAFRCLVSRPSECRGCLSSFNRAGGASPPPGQLVEDVVLLTRNHRIRAFLVLLERCGSSLQRKHSVTYSDLQEI